MDLKAAMKKSLTTPPFAQSEVRYMVHQLSAMALVHEQWFIHRAGRIALCDFGLARKYEVP